VGELLQWGGIKSLPKLLFKLLCLSHDDLSNQKWDARAAIYPRAIDMQQSTATESTILLFVLFEMN
jgi:hypothetical protein